MFLPVAAVLFMMMSMNMNLMGTGGLRLFMAVMELLLASCLGRYSLPGYSSLCEVHR